MRKILLLTLLTLLTGCSFSNSNNQNSGEPNNNGQDNEPNDPTIEPPIEEHIPNKNILLTEINTGTSVVNRSLEISNIGNEDISLDHYSIEIYRSFSNKYNEQILLDDYVIKANSSFVIAYSGANDEIKNKADLITDNYLNNGTFPISLSYYNEPYDAIGLIGYNYDFAEYAVLVRLKEHLVPTLDFNLSEWVRYPINTISTLGNLDCIDEISLLDGPKLSKEDFEIPFTNDGASGTGGALQVSLSWTSDGDTTGFNYGNKYSSYGVSGGLSTRYYAVNTPEIAHSAGEVADPYGNEARDFTNSLLRKAKSFVVQSVKDYSLHETYGRMLGYVWISDKDNPNPEDYVLLNHLIVKNGFSKPAFLTRDADYNSLMTYKGISYVEFIYSAENYARDNKLNLYSEE